MSITVRIPSPLRKLAAGNLAVTCSGQNLREVLANLDEQYPGFQERLCEENGDLRRFVNIYVGENDIRFLEGLDTEVKAGTDVSIIPAMAGGR